jgi:hypothetical protein
LLRRLNIAATFRRLTRSIKGKTLQVSGFLEISLN